jgi:hypothetical protein
MKQAGMIVISVAALIACTVGTLSGQSPHSVVADFDAVVAPPPPAYGTNVWWTDQDAAQWTSRWAELGPAMVRVPVFHGIVEPANDNNDPAVIDWDGFRFDQTFNVPTTMRTITYRAWLQALRDQPSLRVLIYFPYLAPWLSDNPPLPGLPLELAPHPPNDLAEYREFVETVLRYLVETLGFAPERILVEAMNEPDLGCGADPVVACFWQNWSMDDIADVVRVTHKAIQTVDPDITLVGLSECSGTDVVRNLLDGYPEGAYLEGLSYHYYSPSGYDLNVALSRASALTPYDLPIYLDEYGSRQYLSDGVEGALWHSWALTTLWEASIAPLQYPIARFPFIGEPYSSMGLFENWHGDWTRKPSYWVHTNFFRTVGGGEVISHTAPSELDVLVVRQIVPDEVQATFWVVNRASQTLRDQPFVIHEFPTDNATLRVYDNLVGPTPTLTTTISGSPLVFTATLPAHSSRSFVLTAEKAQDTIDHVLLAPGIATRMVGQTISYTLTAYDPYSSSWDVTSSATYTIESSAGGEWRGNAYTTEVSGTWTVTGTYGGQSDYGVLVVRSPKDYAYLPLILREAVLQ